MIAFGICVGSEERLERCALAGLRRVSEPDSPVATSRDNDSIFTAYNEMLDAFGDDERLEALVLLHEDVEILDRAFCDKIRSVLSEPRVAIAGVIGARNVTSLKWWDGDGCGRVRESRGVVDLGRGRHDVDVVDGLLLALSPWAVRNLRFDDANFCGFHGYDVDICFQARAAGMRVVIEDIDVMHHTNGGYGDVATYTAADEMFRAKWAAETPTQSAEPLDSRAV